MFSHILKNAASLKSINPAIFTIGLTTKTPLEKTEILHGLTYFQKSYPNLIKSEFDQKEDSFRLTNDQEEYEKKLVFHVFRSSVFNFSWGTNAEFGSYSDAEKLGNNLQEGFSLIPINIELIDIQAHFICNWNGHHYKAIWNAFFKNSPIFSIFNPDKILHDDLKFRALFDDNKTIVIRISSNVNDIEIKKEIYKDDLITASIGIAKTGSFKPDCNISQEIKEHINSCINYMQEKFMVSVIVPLDESLTILRVGVGNGT